MVSVQCECAVCVGWAVARAALRSSSSPRITLTEALTELSTALRTLLVFLLSAARMLVSYCTLAAFFLRDKVVGVLHVAGD